MRRGSTTNSPQHGACAIPPPPPLRELLLATSTPSFLASKRWWLRVVRWALERGHRDGVPLPDDVIE
jgi:hypothetical protein